MQLRVASEIVRVAPVVLLAPVACAMGSESSEGPNLFTGDLGNIIWTLATFLAVLIVLRKFAWRPILNALQKREDFIRDSLERAKKDREEAEARLAEYERRLQAARDEAMDIVEESRRDAEVVKRRVEEEAKTGAEAMIKRAKREISIATDSALKEIYSQSAKLATEVAGRIIRKELDAKEHERLIRESIEELAAQPRNGRGLDRP